MGESDHRLKMSSPPWHPWGSLRVWTGCQSKCENDFIRSNEPLFHNLSPIVLGIVLWEFCLCDQVRQNLIDRTWSFGTFRSAADLILGGAFLELNLWHSLYGRHHIWRVRYSIHLSSNFPIVLSSNPLGNCMFPPPVTLTGEWFTWGCF